MFATAVKEIPENGHKQKRQLDLHYKVPPSTFNGLPARNTLLWSFTFMAISRGKAGWCTANH